METLIRDALKDFDTFKELTEAIPLEVLVAEAEALPENQQQIFQEYQSRLQLGEAKPIGTENAEYRLIRQSGRTLFLEAVSPDKKALPWFRDRFGCELLIDFDYALQIGLTFS